MHQKINEDLLDFIRKSPTAFQAVGEMKKRLREAGFTGLSEEERWKLEPGGRYYVVRNHSALIAFSVPASEEPGGFHIIASHSDSPALKLKEKPELAVEKAYIKLNVEKYGGPLLESWFDRPLSVAGRIFVREMGMIQEKPVMLDRDLLVIPRLAIHMNREANDGVCLNVQKDMLPLYSGMDGEGTLMELIAAECGSRAEDILGHDLFLYDRTPGCVWGAHKEFLSAPRLDDLQCAFASLEGFLQGEKKETICVHCVLDNEEVGSVTKQGAASAFLKDTLLRIDMSLGRDYEDHLVAMAKSFMISADNAHALHPNHTEKTDPGSRPVLNGGIVIKYAASQKYCTDGRSGAVFREICREAGVPCQVFVNRSDMAGGSTLGNISNTQAALHTVDVGLPQLAMHSCYETAGARDTAWFIQAAKRFFR